MTYTYTLIPLKKIIKLSKKNKQTKEKKRCKPIKIYNKQKQTNKKQYKTQKNKLYRTIKKMSVNNKWLHRVKKKVLKLYQKNQNKT